MPKLLEGKRIVLVDDSIVRGTTTPQVIRMLRRAGAKEVHMRICAPPIRHPCFFGVDMATRQELIAAQKTIPEIRDGSESNFKKLNKSGLSLSNIRTTQQEVSRKNLEKALDAYYPNTWEGKRPKIKLSAPTRAMMLDNMETFRELLTGVPTFSKEDAKRIVLPTIVLSGKHTIKFMKAVAMELLKNAGIACEGRDQPRRVGQRKEAAYAQATLDAALRVNDNPRPFYFLWVKTKPEEMPDVPIWCAQKDKDRAVASIVACAGLIASSI
jgi:hypothetical protein